MTTTINYLLLLTFAIIAKAPEGVWGQWRNGPYDGDDIGNTFVPPPYSIGGGQPAPYGGHHPDSVKEDSYEESYENSYEESYEESYEDSYEDSHEDLYEDSYEGSYEDSYEDSHEDSHEDSREDSHEASHEDSYEGGYNPCQLPSSPSDCHQSNSSKELSVAKFTCDPDETKCPGGCCKEANWECCLENPWFVCAPTFEACPFSRTQSEIKIDSVEEDSYEGGHHPPKPHRERTTTSPRPYPLSQQPYFPPDSHEDSYEHSPEDSYEGGHYPGRTTTSPRPYPLPQKPYFPPRPYPRPDRTTRRPYVPRPYPYNYPKPQPYINIQNPYVYRNLFGRPPRTNRRPIFRSRFLKPGGFRFMDYDINGKCRSYLCKK